MRRQLGAAPTRTTDAVTLATLGALNLYGPYASRPAASMAGRCYECTDNGNTYYDTGTTWLLVSVSGSGIKGVEPPAFTSTTPLGSATITADKGTRLITTPGTGSGTTYAWRVEYQTLSPTSGYTCIGHVTMTTSYATASYAGLVLYNSTSGSFITFGLSTDSSNGQAVRALKWTSPTAYSAEYGSAVVLSQIPGGRMPNWFRFREDGTNRYLEYSLDGVDWMTHSSASRTDFITPDRVGWGFNNSLSATYVSRLRSFAVTSP